MPFIISGRRTAVRGGVFAAVAVSAALALSACSGGSDDAAAKPGATPSATGTAPASTAPAQPGGAADPSQDAAQDASQTQPTAPAAAQGNQGKDTAQNAAAGGGQGSGADRCHTADLSIDFAAGHAGQNDTGSPDQRTTLVLIDNKSGRTCTLKGFPGVDLRSGSDTWSLVRSGETPRKITLAPGGSTQFAIRFLPFVAGSGENFQPRTVVVTPPDETTSVTVEWPWGGIIRQDGATHPGTFTGPIGS